MDTEKYAFVTDEIEHDINNLSENEMKLYKKLNDEMMKSKVQKGKITNLLSLWSEFGGNDAPSIKDSFEDKGYPGQDDIVRYLENGRVKLPSAGTSVDALTGEIVSVRHAIMTDGEYSWDSMLPYYVKKYNVRMPEDFERKVLSVK